MQYILTPLRRQRKVHKQKIQALAGSRQPSPKPVPLDPRRNGNWQRPPAPGPCQPPTASCYTVPSAKGVLAMAEKKPQTFANHTRFDPPFHFFILPMFGVLLLGAVIHFFAHFKESDSRDLFHNFVFILLVLALVGLTLKTRLYAVKVQDRVIRLEERLRLATLVSEPLRSRILELTEGQLVALRFASDGEVSKLA